MAQNKRGKDISGGFIFWSMVGACLVGLTAWISSVGSTVGVDATLYPFGPRGSP
ncbi:hypothetical protein [Escherichia coli]|uniref:hypothetical protein n=1 Tax=Escherichia coli TaxID=562 RepID=UPI002022CEE5|nr:hypothetical protein [Escherichia coli]